MQRKSILGRNFLELTGCIHNHSVYSYDSKVPLVKIIAAAKLNNLDYITINDHMTFAALQDKAYLEEKDLIIIVGAEINDRLKNNHYLVFNTDQVIRGATAEEYVKAYREAEAIGFAAHPIEKRKDQLFRMYPWTNLENDGFDGLEIWNYLSEWVGKLKPSRNGLFQVLFPHLFLYRPYRETLDYWDALNSSGKRRAGIGSVDCHQEKHRKLGIRFIFLTHKTSFRGLRTNVLLPEGSNLDSSTVLNALRKGNSYIINYRCGAPIGFYAAVAGNGESAICGEEIGFNPDLKFYYRLGRYGRVALYRNGVRIALKYDDKGYFSIKETGNYRLEITRFGRGWIYTNNIYVI